MAYKKTLWKDRVVEKPNTYRSVENPDGTITLYPITGQVIEKGTPVSAANLNKIENGIVELNEQLEHNTNILRKLNILTELIANLSNKTINTVRWIGDSISVGHDSTGAGVGTEGNIIFKYKNEAGMYEPKRDSIGYVNRLRLLFKKINPNCDLLNASFSGRSVKEAYQYKEGYILTPTQLDDVLFIAFGTNDLHMCSSLEEFRTYYQNFLQFMKPYAKQIICVTPPPILDEANYPSNYPSLGSTPVSFKISECIGVIKDVANKNNCAVIDLNTEILKKFDGEVNQKLFYHDNVVHPSDYGHTVIFKICEELLGVSFSDEYHISNACRNTLNFKSTWQNANIDNGNDLPFSAITIKNKVIIKGIIKGENIEGNEIAQLISNALPNKTQYFSCIYNDGTGIKTGLLAINKSGVIYTIGISSSNILWLNIDTEILI